MWGQLRIIQGGHLKIRGTGKNSNMRGIQNFLGVGKTRGGKAFRGPVTDGCNFILPPVFFIIEVELAKILFLRLMPSQSHGRKAFRGRLKEGLTLFGPEGQNGPLPGFLYSSETVKPIFTKFYEFNPNRPFLFSRLPGLGGCSKAQMPKVN